MERVKVLSGRLCAPLVLFCLFVSSILYAGSREFSSPEIAFVSKMAVIVIGLLLLGAGWRLYKITISITGLVMGIYIAWFLVPQYFEISRHIQFLIMIIFGIAGFILALPFQKAIVFFLGGLGGLILISNPVSMLVREHENSDMYILGAALLGFILFGILSIYFFKFIIIVSTSIIGSFNFMVGIYALFESRKGESGFVKWMDPSDKGFFFFLLISFFGILVQHGINKVFPEAEEKQAEEKKESSGEKQKQE